MPSAVSILPSMSKVVEARRPSVVKVALVLTDGLVSAAALGEAVAVLIDIGEVRERLEAGGVHREAIGELAEDLGSGRVVIALRLLPKPGKLTIRLVET